MSMYTAEEIRNTILGKIKWHSCPVCEGTRLENWNEDGEDVKSGHTSDPDRDEGICENCEGLGFVSYGDFS